MLKQKYFCKWRSGNIDTAGNTSIGGTLVTATGASYNSGSTVTVVGAGSCL